MTSSNEPSNEFVNSPLSPETLLQGRYRIVKQLGRGGMGAVYEAVDQRLGITVALKETLSAEPLMRKQFEHEARLLAGMQHPALPRVSDHFVEGHRAFLVMQFIGGVDLARIISKQPGPFPRDQVIAWADQLLDALVYLHSRDRQVIHRDIKPHNLKLTGTGQIALLDFGLAKAQPADISVTSSRAFFGYTKHYAPLEQIQDQRTDPRSDIYALGATLYHLLTGIKPPDALVRASALLNAEPDPLKPANRIHPIVGSEIASILQRALALKSEERFATASEFREALRRIGRAANDGMIEEEVAVQEPTHTESTRVQKRHSVDINLAMVASARRFGPGGLTVVLLLVGAVAAGVLYASPNWFGSSAAVTTKTSASSGLPLTPKPARSNSQPGVAAKPKNQSEPNVSEKVVRMKDAKPEFETSPKRAVEETKKPPRVRGKVGAPTIRLPEPNFGEPTARLRPQAPSYSSSNPAPEFFRAPDGTRIVKFSDGTTRVIPAGCANSAIRLVAQPNGIASGLRKLSDAQTLLSLLHFRPHYQIDTTHTPLRHGKAAPNGISWFTSLGGMRGDHLLEVVTLSDPWQAYRPCYEPGWSQLVTVCEGVSVDQHRGLGTANQSRDAENGEPPLPEA